MMRWWLLICKLLGVLTVYIKLHSWDKNMAVLRNWGRVVGSPYGVILAHRMKKSLG
jgi:hypothetical protein